MLVFSQLSHFHGSSLHCFSMSTSVSALWQSQSWGLPNTGCCDVSHRIPWKTSHAHQGAWSLVGTFPGGRNRLIWGNCIGLQQQILAQVHLLRSCTIFFYQSLGCLPHLLIIDPQLACSWSSAEVGSLSVYFQLICSSKSDAAAYSKFVPLIIMDVYIFSAWLTNVSNCESSSCSSDTTRRFRHLSTSRCPRNARYTDFPAFMYSAASDPYTTSMIFLSLMLSISVHIAPSRFINVWKPPGISTMSFREVSFGASMMISAAFQWSGWSNVIIGGELCFIARLQTKSKVDKMHVLSPEYRSIIGRNTTEDCTGYSDPWWMI